MYGVGLLFLSENNLWNWQEWKESKLQKTKEFSYLEIEDAKNKLIQMLLKDFRV